MTELTPPPLDRLDPAGARTFALTRRPLELRFRRATLAGRKWPALDYLRVRLTGPELVGFGSAGDDDHIRVFFPGAGDPVGTAEELRAAPSREYTPLAWGDDGATGWLDLEFAGHGGSGVGARWAATAPPGSVVGIGGPRRTMSIEGKPEAWLLAGDEAAIPQIKRYAALIRDDTPATILVEVADAAHAVPIQAPVPVTYVPRDGRPAGSALAAALDAIGAADRPTGAVFGFVAAEASIVPPARALLLDRWGLDPETVVAKGYWKLGEPEYHAPH